MITQQNFKDVLLSLGFSRSGNTYTHQPGGHLLQVDFDTQKLIYPETAGLTIVGQFTTNFSSNENFVVFECVHRLLTLGYQPAHITLEPKYKVGHGASGGRADIQIKNNSGAVFAIIECKTAGEEFDKEWAYMQQYPSQLFSYAQQERTTEVLCLYASDWSGTAVTREYYALSLRDNESLLQNDSLTYAAANTHAALFEAWKQTYGGEVASVGLFEDGSAPLLFGRKNYSVADLQPLALADIQKKYHRFATILRKHNVSGRENAFDKLVNLFLCKVVDEKENPTNLRFHWKGLANDTHELFQDRLQSLYQQGMGRFLKEDVTYISQQQIDDAFRFLDPKDPDATKRVISDYFKRLKFYTNNDFAFIEVHNEALFKKNAAVLLEIVEMLQGIRLVGDEDVHTNQFLGDMFEGFLDAGVKQSEGQFFTPMPIVKAIMAALPLAHIVAESDAPPKAIDYACGAGHFLTELAQKLKPHVAALKTGADIREYYNAITGIEKEYRLSKVAKVSAFMYGQDDINIIHADALAHNPQVAEGTYQILVANPPYSVKGFLETLAEKDRRAYELYGNIDAKSTLRNNAIETFFIERAARLLAPGGVAAIILPSSILSNDGSQYQKTREILLRRFHIRAIAELGSGTFGKTGTNTVTLFLHRRHGNPSEEEHYRNRAADWTVEGDTAPGSKKNGKYQDLYLLEAYAAHLGLPFADYEAFLRTRQASDALRATEWWMEYEKAFNTLTNTKNFQKRPAFKALPAEGRAAELAALLARHIIGIEEDKLYYFLLATHNDGDVLIIRSPADGKEMKKFLGYEWSAAKGSEGIKYLNAPAQPAEDGEDAPQTTTAQLASIQTPLYNPANDDDDTKLSFYIRQSFLGAPFTLPENLRPFAHKALLVDMLDFGRKDFSKAISLTAKKKNDVVSRWEVKKLEDLAILLQRGKSPVYGSSSLQVIKSGQARGGRKFDFSKPEFASDSFKTDERALQKGDILINSTGKGTAGRVTLFELDGDFVADNHITIFRTNNSLTSEYALHYFESYLGFKTLESYAEGVSGQIELSLKLLENLRIPVPPKDVQAQIVAECRAVDSAAAAAEKEIAAAQEVIEQKVRTVLSQHTSSQINIGNLAETTSGGTPLSSNRAFYDGGTIPWINSGEVNKGEILVGENFITEAGLNNSSAKMVPANSVLLAMYGATAGKVAILKIEAATNQAICAILPNEKYEPKFLKYQLDSMYDQLLSLRTGVARDNLSQAKIRDIRIILPPLSVQQALIEEIEIEEARIAVARQALDDAPAQKAAILRAHLE